LLLPSIICDYQPSGAFAAGFEVPPVKQDLVKATSLPPPVFARGRGRAGSKPFRHGQGAKMPEESCRSAGRSADRIPPS
jgi:hypothetical protein